MRTSVAASRPMCTRHVRVHMRTIREPLHVLLLLLPLLLPLLLRYRGGGDTRTGVCIGAHTPSFLSPRWFNEPIRRSFLPAVPPTSSLGHTPTLSDRPYPSLFRFPTLHCRVVHPFVACPHRISPPATPRSLSRSRVHPIPVISFLNFLVATQTTHTTIFLPISSAAERRSVSARPIAAPTERNIEIGFPPQKGIIITAPFGIKSICRELYFARVRRTW